MRVDWEKPRFDDLAVAGALMLAEAVLLYYSVLVVIMAARVIAPSQRVGRVRRMFVYGPVIVIITLAALLEVLDALARRL